MAKPEKMKVFFTGGDGVGWALDEDAKLTKLALEGMVEYTDLHGCDVIHTVWISALSQLMEKDLQGKTILCHAHGEAFRYLRTPGFRALFKRVSCFVARSRQGEQQYRSLGMPAFYLPYPVDISTFKPLESQDPSVNDFISSWSIPRDKYLIGNFNRDSSGVNLNKPKLEKGTDIFLEILLLLQKRGLPIHVVLAGPRRHWIISCLNERKIPYTFVGNPSNEDDVISNTLDRKQLNILYNLINLYLISSRSEGGPQSVFEASASRCKIISNTVGDVPQVLEPGCIYDSIENAALIIKKDVESEYLHQYTELHYKRIQDNNTIESVSKVLEQLYSQLGSFPVYQSSKQAVRNQNIVNKISRKVFRILNREQKIRISLWHNFVEPPYGGGNQFMLMLRKGLTAKGIDVAENTARSDVDVYILNSIHFDTERFRKLSNRRNLKIIHRIDGPIHLIRGKDRDKDELCYALNKQLAYATVIQSNWCFQKIVESGYLPVNPVIINNTVDPEIFNGEGRIPFSPDRKIRLISTSWSPNVRKGGPVYKWLEENLDWSRFEYTFVGNASEQFKRLNYYPPMGSKELAEILKKHDIYITASQNDPCSNALIEALACGLPALYLNDGGHPELVSYGGLPFNDKDEILPQLNRIVNNYESFQRLITISSFDEVIDKYLQLISDAVNKSF
ncbi:MAG: glycosyltransferase [Candidatus Glassbacteria bacterium]